MKTVWKWLNNRWILKRLLVLVALAWLVSCGVAVDLSKSDWASWVQAVGSIAAILFAVIIGERQAASALETVRQADHLSAERKYDSIIALAESTETFMTAVMECFAGGRFGYLQFKMRYRKAAFDSLVEAVKAVSAQDLGSYNSILGWTLLREAVVYFQGHMVKVETFIESQQNQNGGISNNLPWDAGSMEMCHLQAKQTIEVLRDHRPTFAT